MSIIIEGASIIDGTGREPFQADVTIEGDRITAVGEAEGSNEDERIDASGLTLMPGLIDAHCHMTFDEPSSNDELFFHRREGLAAIIAAQNVRKLLNAGVTAFVDPDCIFDVGIDLRDAIEANVIPGPRMLCGGNALLTSVGGTAGRLIPDEGLRGYAKIVSSPEEIRTEVRRQIKKGVDWIKVHVTGLLPRQTIRGEIQAWSLDELKLVCDTAHELGIPVMGHCRNAESIRDSVLAGMDMLLHATFMDEPTLELLCEHKVPVVPTFTFQANLADYGDAVGADPGLREVFRKEIEESAVQIRQAYEAGVPVLCGTESGFSITPYGDWHYRELEVFVRDMGFSPLEAITAATKACGEHAGFNGETGSIEPGKLADLILVDGDPSKDVTVLGEPENIKHVMVGGKSMPLEPLPPREPINGWRTSQYSSGILTKQRAKDI
ncbi:MAG: amidohydrolase family protein [Pseudomonadales bacterium]|jgi:imidazolonepropionase-like amidohydrolase|nr:amidohydrolase family protein [Pseudomonadales bacterium]